MATTTLSTDPTQLEQNSPMPATTAPAPVAPAAPTPTAYQSATDYNVPGASDTVEGRLTGLLDQKSDYMRRAETKGAQYANQRGILNSSMAAGAAQAASIDAALPIAQQDADWENKNRMQADTMAHDRGMETYKQEMLAWDQFLKGVSDISMQDLDPAAKDKAVQNLRDNYFAGSGIASSLRGVTIQDGNVVYGEPVTSSAVTTGGAVGEAAPTAPSVSGAAPAIGAVNDPSDILSYESKDAMSLEQRRSFEAAYGAALEPPQVKTIRELAAWYDAKYKGQTLNSGGELDKQRKFATLLQQNGIPVEPGNAKEVFKGAAGEGVARILGNQENTVTDYNVTKYDDYGRPMDAYNSPRRYSY